MTLFIVAASASPVPTQLLRAHRLPLPSSKPSAHSFTSPESLLCLRESRLCGVLRTRASPSLPLVKVRHRWDWLVPPVRQLSFRLWGLPGQAGAGEHGRPPRPAAEKPSWPVPRLPGSVASCSVDESRPADAVGKPPLSGVQCSREECGCRNCTHTSAATTQACDI